MGKVEKVGNSGLKWWKSGEKCWKVVKNNKKWRKVRKSREKCAKSGEKWLGVAICAFMWLKVVV